MKNLCLTCGGGAIFRGNPIGCVSQLQGGGGGSSHSLQQTVVDCKRGGGQVSDWNLCYPAYVKNSMQRARARSRARPHTTLQTNTAEGAATNGGSELCHKLLLLQNGSGGEETSNQNHR